MTLAQGLTASHHTIEIEITVMADDIAYGEPCSSKGCPIARATLRQLPGFRVRVASDHLIVYKGGCSWSGRLPAAARTLILLKDSGMAPAPVSFDVRLNRESGWQ